ncbi:permease [Magnetofaba australis]|uniref:Putative permease n=1 Tax=Magnetofaba australis IT-1 TaxID=1434232 RepID=A0A1Y2K5F0_9PROT|nr:permease [Magnetofaba australis]OSM04914.1 putative permease [Magnetofaba australis IT-1]
MAPAERDKAFIALLLFGFLALFFSPSIGLLSGPDPVELLRNAPGVAPSRWRENFSAYFISICLEAGPFMLLGAVTAALIEVFAPANLLPRLARRLGVLGIPAAALAAPLLPVCECGVVPVFRKLINKGLPLPHAIAYLLAAPIFNPIVLTGTWIAYYRDPLYPFLRGLGGLSVALAVALLIAMLLGLRSRFKARADGAHALEHGHDDGACCAHGHEHAPSPGRLQQLLRHAQEDFQEMAPYFLFGAFLAACLKTFVDQTVLFDLGDGDAAGAAAMMALAFVLSLCSEADAFVSASFVEFNVAAHMGFLVLGPMLDIKLLVMYRSVFSGRFILLLASAVIAGVSAYVWALNLWGWEWVDALLGQAG